MEILKAGLMDLSLEAEKDDPRALPKAGRKAQRKVA